MNTKGYRGDLNSPTYTPGRLLDKVARLVNARSDSDLGRRIDVAPTQISRVRGRKEPLSHRVLVAVLDNTSLTIAEVRELCGWHYKDKA